MSVLSAAATRRLTGYVKPSKQIEWLERNGFQRGVHYFVNAAGHPVVWRVLDNRTSTKPELGHVP